MDLKSQKLVITIDHDRYLNWKLFLTNEFKKITSKNVEIDCRDINLSCKEILSLIEISNEFDCKIIGFFSTSTSTIISAQSLGYPSQLILKKSSSNSNKINNVCPDLSTTRFHQGTVRSGEYVESSGDLLILGDVNPGAIVKAEGNVIIWGRLLGIAHAGSKGNSKAKIAALQLRPVQLRIANKVARGPKGENQLGLAEQATIDSEKIIISPLELT